MNVLTLVRIRFVVITARKSFIQQMIVKGTGEKLFNWEIFRRRFTSCDLKIHNGLHTGKNFLSVLNVIIHTLLIVS